ncbi:hypothetical protein FOE78_20895 [Microlunatus elymi]|uniref:Uncharacterized protein n=1 Tax=Microlunatus elymi TaxID=2596828 RepID=A0A516Q3N8_9ACTN|nr:hypothetical protein [Microlunatus elymi]QDP98028.1 hypothetical protein FOE78_20895 [Microlunatus elymi]
MTGSEDSGRDAVGVRWHEALAYAITGQRLDGLGTQPTPDLQVVAAAIADRSDGGPDGLRELIRQRRAAGEPWPYPVPAELRQGIGAAQWIAALNALRQRLDLDNPERPVLSDRAPDADERRLLADVPPHHGH